MPLIGLKLLSAYQASGVMQLQRGIGGFLAVEDDMHVFGLHIRKALDEPFGNEAAWTQKGRAYPCMQQPCFQAIRDILGQADPLYDRDVQQPRSNSSCSKIFSYVRYYNLNAVPLELLVKKTDCQWVQIRAEMNLFAMPHPFLCRIDEFRLPTIYEDTIAAFGKAFGKLQIPSLYAAPSKRGIHKNDIHINS